MVVPNKMKLCSILPPHDYITLPGTRECARIAATCVISVELSFSAWYEVRRIAFPLRLQGGLLSFWIGPPSQRNQFGSQI